MGELAVKWIAGEDPRGSQCHPPVPKSTNPLIQPLSAMRRFSKRSHLVTLSEINITPLLDLAFVLLIIFVITTPLLEQSINLKLPKAGRPEQHFNKSDIRTVEISNTGTYALDKKRMQVGEIISQLVTAFHRDPNLVVYIRADKESRYDLVAQLLDGCEKYGITRYSLRTDPTPK
jgi:biopolymer transport protein ExbD